MYTGSSPFVSTNKRILDLQGFFCFSFVFQRFFDGQNIKFYSRIIKFYAKNIKFYNPNCAKNCAKNYKKKLIHHFSKKIIYCAVVIVTNI